MKTLGIRLKWKPNSPAVCVQKWLQRFFLCIGNIGVSIAVLSLFIFLLALVQFVIPACHCDKRDIFGGMVVAVVALVICETMKKFSINFGAQSKAVH